MTLTTALMTAVGALVSVVVFLAGVIGYLWKELRAQYRERAKDSALFLSTLEQSRSKYSGRALDPVPSETPAPPEGFYSMRSTKTNQTRR